MLLLIFRTIAPILVATVVCLSTTGCGWDDVTRQVNQWMGKPTPTSQTAPTKASNSIDTPKHGIALPPDIPVHHAAADETTAATIGDLHADPVLVDTATSEALALGLAEPTELSSPSWQQLPLTRGQLAQWLASWVEPQKGLPALPAISASPFNDVTLDNPHLPALRVATTAHWFLLPGNTAPTPETPVAINPDDTLTINELLTTVLRTQKWVQLDGHLAIAAPITPNTLHTEATETGLTDTLFGQPLTQQQFVHAIKPDATQLQGLMVMAFWL